MRYLILSIVIFAFATSAKAFEIEDRRRIDDSGGLVSPRIVHLRTLSTLTVKVGH